MNKSGKSGRHRSAVIRAEVNSRKAAAIGAALLRERGAPTGLDAAPAGNNHWVAGRGRSLLVRKIPRDSIAAQLLFSVYLHPAPGFKFKRSSLFYGYEIPRRVDVSWGQYSVVCLIHPPPPRQPVNR